MTVRWPAPRSPVTTGSSGQQPMAACHGWCPAASRPRITTRAARASPTTTRPRATAAVNTARTTWTSGIRACSEGYYTGANATGEWLEYTVDVATTGQYQLDLRVATPNSGRQLRVSLDGADVSGLINVPNTGSWSVLADGEHHGQPDRRPACAAHRVRGGRPELQLDRY